MAVNYNPKATTDNLLLCLDAANKKSYNSAHNLFLNSNALGSSGETLPTGWGIGQFLGGNQPGFIRPSNGSSVTINGIGYYQFDLVGTFNGFGNRLLFDYGNVAVTENTTYTFTYNYGLPAAHLARGAGIAFNLLFYTSGFGFISGLNQNSQTLSGINKSSYTFITPAGAVRATFRFDFFGLVAMPSGTAYSALGYLLGGFQLNNGNTVTDYVPTTISRILPSTTCTDLSSLGNNGTIRGGTAHNSRGRFTFDGIDDDIQLNNTLANFVNKSVTAEAWVYQTYPTYRATAVMQSSTFQVGGWSLVLNYGNVNNICMFFQNTGLDMIVLSDTNVGAFINSWNHVVGSYNSLDNSVNLYLNGKLVKSSIITTSAGQTSNLLYIGRPTQGGWNFFTGDIGLAKIYDRALTATEVAQNYNATSGRYEYTRPVLDSSLMLYLDASQVTSYSGTGSTWTDLSGNSKNYTLTNSPTYSFNNGGVITFAGASSQYTTNSVALYDANSFRSYTMSLWVYPTGAGAFVHVHGQPTPGTA